MPKILIFVPCEKVIISQDENNPTLIAVLTQVGGTVKRIGETDAALSGNALGVVPMRWTVFTTWQRLPGDENKTFVQGVKLVSPSGKIAIDAAQEITLTKGTHRVLMRIDQFPVETGDWEIQLFLTEKGQPTPTAPLAIYPLRADFDVSA